METFLYTLDDEIFDIDYYESSIDYSDELASTGSNESDIENMPLNACSYVRRAGKGSGKKVLQRKAANMRERRRMKSINDAFDCLRKCIPVTESVDRKLSKVDTLKLAMSYISYLGDLIKSTNDLNSPGAIHATDRTQDKVILRCQFTGSSKFYLELSYLSVYHVLYYLLYHHHRHHQFNLTHPDDRIRHSCTI